MDLRAEGYALLSECYKEPTQTFAADVAAGRLDARLRAVFESLGVPDPPALGVPGAADDVCAALTGEFHALFSVPSVEHFVLPVESAFKDWTEGSPLLDARVTGLIMGAPATDMLRRYAARGLVLPDAFKDRPDHLALLLEYGALLCEWGETEEQHEFVRTHLDRWVTAFRDEVQAKSTSTFYRAVTAATLAFLEAERAHLAIPDGCSPG